MIGNPRPFAAAAHRRDDDLVGPQSADDFQSGDERHARWSGMGVGVGFSA